MATPESKVKDKIKAQCKARGAYYAMPVMGGMASNGTPDFLICYKGQFIAVVLYSGCRLGEVDRSTQLAGIKILPHNTSWTSA